MWRCGHLPSQAPAQGSPIDKLMLQLPELPAATGPALRTQKHHTGLHHSVMSHCFCHALYGTAYSQREHQLVHASTDHGGKYEHC